MAQTARRMMLLTLMLTSATAHAAGTIQVARSATLELDATVRGRSVVLHVLRNADHTFIDGTGRVAAEIDGHSVQLKPEGTGYVLSTADLSGGTHTLQVVVAHNGIHELLTAPLALPKRTDRLALLERHGYGAWWVLNIVVLLLAARLIMRRKAKPPTDSR